MAFVSSSGQGLNHLEGLLAGRAMHGCCLPGSGEVAGMGWLITGYAGYSMRSLYVASRCAFRPDRILEQVQEEGYNEGTLILPGADGQAGELTAQTFYLAQLLLPRQAALRYFSLSTSPAQHCGLLQVWSYLAS